MPMRTILRRYGTLRRDTAGDVKIDWRLCIYHLIDVPKTKR